MCVRVKRELLCRTSTTSVSNPSPICCGWLWLPLSVSTRNRMVYGKIQILQFTSLGSECVCHSDHVFYYFVFFFCFIAVWGMCLVLIIWTHYRKQSSIAGQLWRAACVLWIWQGHVSVAQYHFAVWKNFWFSVSSDDVDKKVVDETAKVCKQCCHLSNFVATFSNF